MRRRAGGVGAADMPSESPTGAIIFGIIRDVKGDDVFSFAVVRCRRRQVNMNDVVEAENVSSISNRRSQVRHLPVVERRARSRVPP